MLHVACVSSSGKQKVVTSSFSAAVLEKYVFTTSHEFIHTVLILIYDCKNTHALTHICTCTYCSDTWQRKKNNSFLWKTSTCNSKIKCYTFCKMFHNSFYWFKWLSYVHYQLPIVPHLMLMNACCMDTSCIIPFIFVIVDFFMAKKLMQYSFIPLETDFCIFNSLITPINLYRGDLAHLLYNNRHLYSFKFRHFLFGAGGVKGKFDNHWWIIESQIPGHNAPLHAFFIKNTHPVTAPSPQTKATHDLALFPLLPCTFLTCFHILVNWFPHETL